ncbi:hypothetical protein SEA_NICHOLAS_1 [Mycobacterium phage Nicholas]|uniref:Uncharacterized protein n=1 Tax=Mycobacterium phage Lumos TaxID=1701852 RepID=A0A0K2CLU5_9CAUD|nr:hypothetical protein AVU96_gp001 [Mycobacterium phage Snenia]YP_010012459.1 hypothetical protein J4T93_gp001 [Mycobacterium phage Lumos]ASM62739.1 hypothetical protein SEA_CLAUTASTROPHE_1 [Mycobacterium phage Clautastrophe]ASR86931.1 hypothetical protein SEA_KINGSOLOMON_1 [Mycobacterium phage Kingsolomon]ASR87273.1 hypothetical protein SEA_NICHOLAS_1 [Mycobacterium phage Nicholas]QDF16586.1 hypothetical protein PBI_MSGREEN_1 [Mycobacterium phage MsGreen]QPL14885.1 hypothetical protein SEA_
MGRNAPGAYRGGSRGRDSRKGTREEFEQKRPKDRSNYGQIAAAAAENGWKVLSKRDFPMNRAHPQYVSFERPDGIRVQVFFTATGRVGQAAIANSNREIIGDIMPKHGDKREKVVRWLNGSGSSVFRKG